MLIDRELLTSFFYLLTRGTPGARGLGWGEVNGVIDEARKTLGAGPRAFTSAAGRALGAEMTMRLLGVVPALEPDEPGDTHYRCECCTQTIEHPAGGCNIPGMPPGRPLMPAYFSATRCNEHGRGVVLCEPCALFVDSLDRG